MKLWIVLRVRHQDVTCPAAVVSQAREPAQLELGQQEQAPLGQGRRGQARLALVPLQGAGVAPVRKRLRAATTVSMPITPPFQLFMLTKRCAQVDVLGISAVSMLALWHQVQA